MPHRSGSPAPNTAGRRKSRSYARCAPSIVRQTPTSKMAKSSAWRPARSTNTPGPVVAPGQQAERSTVPTGSPRRSSGQESAARGNTAKPPGTRPSTSLARNSRSCATTGSRERWSCFHAFPRPWFGTGSFSICTERRITSVTGIPASKLFPAVPKRSWVSAGRARIPAIMKTRTMALSWARTSAGPSFLMVGEHSSAKDFAMGCP